MSHTGSSTPLLISRARRTMDYRYMEIYGKPFALRGSTTADRERMHKGQEEICQR
jgi:hypothetical protein